MEDSFGLYAPYYDLLNRGKPYEAEADYVAARLRAARPETTSILELGSGTGVHGRLLAARGFSVHGVERSGEMVAIASAAQSFGSGDFHCQTGDVRHVRMERTFDAVIALFHVISYMTADADLVAVVETAREHLTPGGLFLFDVWHGPAVLAQRPSERERIVEEGPLRVVRKATPELLESQRTVVVNFEFHCENAETGAKLDFSEKHPMRYLFADEIEAAASRAGFRVVGAEELVSAATPSQATWAMTYLLQKL